MAVPFYYCDEGNTVLYHLINEAFDEAEELECVLLSLIPELDTINDELLGIAEDLDEKQHDTFIATAVSSTSLLGLLFPPAYAAVGIGVLASGAIIFTGAISSHVISHLKKWWDAENVMERNKKDISCIKTSLIKLERLVSELKQIYPYKDINGLRAVIYTANVARKGFPALNVYLEHVTEYIANEDRIDGIREINPSLVITHIETLIKLRERASLSDSVFGIKESLSVEGKSAEGETIRLTVKDMQALKHALEEILHLIQKTHPIILKRQQEEGSIGRLSQALLKPWDM